jgi:hypothetical protein
LLTRPNIIIMRGEGLLALFPSVLLFLLRVQGWFSSPALQQTFRSNRCSRWLADPAAPTAEGLVSIAAGDVVAYNELSITRQVDESLTILLGEVQEIPFEGTLAIKPLRLRSSPGEATTALELHAAEDAEMLKTERIKIISVVEPDAIEERRVGCGFGPSNPHGEESEMVYLFYHGLPEGCTVAGV